MSSPIIWNGVYSKSLLNALRMGGLAADPASPAAGDIYFNTTSSALKYYSGTGWQTLSASSASAPFVGSSYYASGAQTVNAAPINFDTSIYDPSSSVTTGASWKFTAPDTAYYDVFANLSISSASTISISLFKNGSSFIFNFGDITASNGQGSCQGTVFLNAGDFIDLRYAGGAVTFNGGTLASTNGCSIYIKKAQSIAAVITNWASYTPTTQGLGTVTVKSAIWRQVGQSYQVKATITAGVCTAVEARIGLPNGGTSSSSLLATNPAGAGTAEAVGEISHNGTTLVSVTNVLCEPSVTYATIGIESATSGGLTKATGTAAINSNETFTALFSVPIQGL